MSSNQYRVWDTGHKAFVDHILIAQDGRLLLNLDDLLVPSIEPERYIVEFATGYPDKNGKMIYQGDIVYDGEDILSSDERYFAVTWGHFQGDSDSCESWVLGGFWEPGLYGSHQYLEVVGTIHETPELLERK